MKKIKNKKIKWLWFPITCLCFMIMICIDLVQPVYALQYGLSVSDVPNDYYSLVPNSISGYMDAQIQNPSASPNLYDVVNIPQRVFPDMVHHSDGTQPNLMSYIFEIPIGEDFIVDNNVSYNTDDKIFTSAYRSVVVSPEIFSVVDGLSMFLCFEYDTLVVPSYNGAVANMSTSFLDWYKQCMLMVEEGEFVYMTCDVNYWTYSNNGYAIPSTYSYELTFDSSMDFYHSSTSGSSVLILYDMLAYIENDLSSNLSLNLGQYLLYFSNIQIFGSTSNVFTTDATDVMFAYLTPYILEENHPFFDNSVSPIEAYHSYYLSINDYFSNPNIPPLAYTPIEAVDMSSWLVRSVGAFMNAEIFPGFFIGGIFAVIVAFPLAIWFLKIVLGG